MKNRITQKITPFLWFNDNAEEAVRFYTSIFDDSKVLAITRYGEGGPRPAGGVLTVKFQIEGQEFVALNGGPHFTPNEAVSFVVNCESQEEVDRFWEKLSAGGETSRCGWLRDRFGFSWQVVPVAVLDMLQDEDAARASRVFAAIMPMEKIELATLQRVYEQG